MSYTFIYTPEKEWWLKINSEEQLLSYWHDVFNPKMQQAIDTINETKEFGLGMQHADIIQTMIGLKAKAEDLSCKEAHEEIVFNMRKAQYQKLLEGENIYINKNLGWNTAKKDIDQFIHKNDFNFPIMTKEKLKIEKFPLGRHYYVFIDGVQLRNGNDLKFDSYEDASKFAKQYLKQE